MAQAVTPLFLAKPALAGLLALAGLGALGQPALHEGPLPTRMQFCQLELQGVEGEARRQQLRECLLRRIDAERLVLRDCRQRVREARVPAADRVRWQRDCEWRALAVHSSELPQPPAPVAVAVPEPAPPAEAAAPDAVAPAAAALPEPAAPVTAVELQGQP